MSVVPQEGSSQIESRRLVSIDVLRGVAVLAVIAIHIPHWAPGGWREHPFFGLSLLAEFGYLGVPLFIVISGFCIHRAAARSKAQTGEFAFAWGQFWKRRFIRLYPPYVAAIGVSLFAAFFLHARFENTASFLGWDLVTHLLLVHNLTDEFATSLGNGALWSLGTEEQLYALYFVLMLIVVRRGDGAALATAFVCTVVWRALVVVLPERGPSLGPFHLGQWFQWPFYYWFHWALGAFAVSAFTAGRVLPAWCRSLRVALALILIGMSVNRVIVEFLADTRFAAAFVQGLDTMSVLMFHQLGELAIATGFFCLINTLLKREAGAGVGLPGAAQLAAVGRISYSIYLVHIPVIFTLEHHLPLGFEPLPWAIRYIVYGGLCLAAGYVFFQLVERWFLAGRLPGVMSRRPLVGATSA